MVDVGDDRDVADVLAAGHAVGDGRRRGLPSHAGPV
jgi:hypothetical protein